MDFVSEQLSNGRRFRVLNVKDDYSKELVGQLVSYSISGHQVARFLDQLIEQRSAPDQITCDNGTEFTSKAMFFWQKESGVRFGFIQPGKPDAERICREFKWALPPRVSESALVQNDRRGSSNHR